MKAQVRIALHDQSVDELGESFGHGELAHHQSGHEPWGALVEARDRGPRASTTHVEADRQVGLEERLPHRIPLRVAVVALIGEERDVPSRQRVLLGEAKLRDRQLGRVDRNRGHPQQSIRGVRAVVSEPPVVATDAVQPQLGVRGLQRAPDVEDLGVDPIVIHVLEPLHRVPCAPALVFQFADVQRELLGALRRPSCSTC